jgi:RNA recognition motif-containing protein
VYILYSVGKNYGYAKFGSKQSAEQAIQMLHGHNVFGNRLKVMLAEPPRNERSDGANYDSKRARHD